MVSIIKNQILKHLSKFAKNLSLDQIQLSTLRGHCELHHLELDERLLTDLLELPPWLTVTTAVCNYVTLKIQWTKLKYVPIHLTLDEVLVDVETTVEPRAAGPGPPGYSSGGKYGFSDRVVDGMTVVVNSVTVNLRSEVFEASFQLSRVLLESRTPRWERGDLRLCRLKGSEHLLLFKVLEWQVMRLEAKARATATCPAAPLRLITNAASCRMVFKKRLSDCSVVGSRLLLVLDALLWALTDAQLVAALHFCRSLAGRGGGAEREPPSPPRNQVRGSEAGPTASLFKHYDVVETSYHLFCTRIDLHLCDDMDPKEARSGYGPLQGGGALHVALEKLLVDYYPLHEGGSREHWPRYTEPRSERVAWLRRLASGGESPRCSCLLVRLGGIAVHEVCSAGRGRLGPRRCLASERPPHGDALHLEWGRFLGSPTPRSYLFARVGPVFLRLDLPTLLWGHAFLRSVCKCTGTGVCTAEVPAVCLEAFLPKVIVSGVCGPGSRDPLGAAAGGAELHFRASRLVATNCGSGQKQQLGECLEALSTGPLLFETSSFPWRPRDPRPIPEALLRRCLGESLSWDVWSVHLDPCWTEFVAAGRPSSFVEPLPLTLWYCGTGDGGCLLLHVHGPLVLRVGHAEYVFGMRLLEALARFAEQLTGDAEAIAAGSASPPRLGLAALWPSVELALLLGGDLGAEQGESVPGSEGVPRAGCFPASSSSSSSSSCPAAAMPTVRGANGVRTSEARAKISTVAPSVVRRGLTSLVASIDSAITKAGSTSGSEAGGANHGESLEEDSGSLRSDLSSDSEQFLAAGLAASPEEEEVPVELGLEATEEDPPGESSPAGAWEGRVVTLRMRNVQLAGSFGPYAPLLLLQGRDLDVVENATEVPGSVGTSGGQLSVRVDAAHGLRALLQGLSLRLSGDAVAGLSRLLKDEGGGTHLPLRLLVHELSLSLQEEGGTVVYVPHCLVDRGPDGDLYLVPVACGSAEESVEQLLCNVERPLDFAGDPAENMESLVRENRQLRQELKGLDALRRENQVLRHQVSDCGEREAALERRLAERGEETRRLEEEKGALLATLRLLEEELVQERSRTGATGCDAFCGTSSSS